MFKLKNLVAVSGLLVLELTLTLLCSVGGVVSNGVVWTTIFFQSILFVLGVSLCVKRKELFCSPFFLLFSMAVLFSVAGEIVFIVRDHLEVGWGGVPDDVSAFYRRFCFVAYIFLLLAAKLGVRSSSLFAINEVAYKSPSQLLVLFLLAYLGIFISTNGFSQVSIFSDNPDAVRYENRELSNVAIGSVFLLVSTLSTVLLMALRESGRLSLFSFFCLFLVFYFPLLLSASRLLMLLPFLFVAMMKVQYLDRLKGAYLARIAVLGVCVLSVAFVFGAYRSSGEVTDIAAVLKFLVSDLFPEFSGTVRTQELVGGNGFVTPLSTVLSGLFPSRFFQLLGLDKFDYFQMVGQLVGEMWNSQYSIRLSLMGELYYTEFYRLVMFFIFFVSFLFFLHFKIYVSPAFFRYVYVVAGLLASLSIPYGAIFLVITIQFLVFALLVFSLIRGVRWIFIALSWASRG